MTEPLMTHKYVRVGKFKNRNCRYALVNGIVFGSVFDAEEYCTANGYDVNVWIESDDPEVLKRCQQIAETVLPGLYLLRDQCTHLYNSLSVDVKTKADARDKAKELHELGWSVHEDWVHTAIGKASGCHDCLKLVTDYIFTLERVLRIRSQ